MQASVTARNNAAATFESTLGPSPNLELRTGLPPANTAAADTGTLISTLPLPADFLNAPANGAVTIIGPWLANAVAAGYVGHWRMKASGGTCHFHGYVAQTWQASTPYVVGQHVANGGRTYRCTTAGTSAGAGGPTTEGSGITDGTAVWAFAGPAELILDNTNVNVGQQITINAATFTMGNA